MNRAALLLCILVMTAASQAQVPRVISYQGILTDTTGTPKSDTTYAFMFRFYGDPVGGALLWSETHDLRTTDGVFSAMLGSQSAFPDSLRFDRPYWLAIQVGLEVLMPRIALGSVAYAVGAQHAAYADTARYLSAAGSVVSGGDFTVGTSGSSGLLTVYSNSIPASIGTSDIQLQSGLLLDNSSAAPPGMAQNSPSVQLRHSSWIPEASAAMENSWYIQNWGFSTPGASGGVLSFINKHQVTNGSYRTIVPFAIDEIGRTLIGFADQQAEGYFGFWGEDFGLWDVILAGTTVVGWPENGVTADLTVTGKTNLNSDLQVSGNSIVSGDLSAGTLATGTGQKFKVAFGSDTVIVANLAEGMKITSSLKPFGHTFTNLPSVVITNTSPTINGLDDLLLSVTGKSGSGFAVRVKNTAAAQSANGVLTFDWVAIGN